MYRPLTPLGIQWRRSRKLLTPSRPYLLEAIAGSGFDVGGFIAFVIFLVVIGVYLRMLWPTITNAAALFGLSRPSHTFAAAGPNPSAPVGSSNPLSDAISSGPTATATAAVTATPYPTYTPHPSPTIEATPTEFNGGQIYDALYSYYNPDLGGPNCHSANWDGVSCADTTASGIRWSQYIGHGAALPPEWLAVLGYGSVIRVVSPDVIAGDYTVIDMCQGCSGVNWADHQFRIDFLDTVQRLQWAYPVKFKIISVVQPVP